MRPYTYASLQTAPLPLPKEDEGSMEEFIPHGTNSTPGSSAEKPPYTALLCWCCHGADKAWRTDAFLSYKRRNPTG